MRGVVDAMRDGVPLERMAILFAGEDPYPRLVHEQLELAGIAHNGVSVRALDNSVFGGALLRLLALPDDGFRRDSLFALLAAVPFLDGQGRPAPGVRWERVSRRAGGRWDRPVASAARRVIRRDRDRRVPGVGARGRGPAARFRRRARGRPGRDPRAEVVVGEGGMGAPAGSPLDRRRPEARDVARLRTGGRASCGGGTRPARRTRRRRGGADARRVPEDAGARAHGPRANASVASVRASSSVRSASRSAPISTGSSCAGSPRACSRPRRRRPVAERPRARRARRRAPAARRSHGGQPPWAAGGARRDDRRLRARLPARRPAAEHRARPLAVPARHGRSPVGARELDTRAPWCTAIASFSDGIAQYRSPRPGTSTISGPCSPANR